MFSKWGTAVVRYRRYVVVIALIFVTFCGVWGTGVFSRLVSGGFDDPGNQSSRATALLDREVGRTDADLIVLVTSKDKTVADPSFAADVERALATLPTADVVRTETYWSTKSPQLVRGDGHTTYAVVTLTDADVLDTGPIDTIRRSLDSRGYQARIGGTAAVGPTISATVSSDIGRAEGISMPILLILLVVIFGGVVAASLPLLIGGISILGAFTSLRVISMFTDVSIFAVNLVTILGLGLAIDYGLLMVGRFREEIAAGHSPAEATARTVRTAGRTVAVSALTVAVALSGLLLFPQTFLRSMGFGGISAVVVAAVAAIVVLPAVLAMLGTRVDKLAVRKRRTIVLNDHDGFWYRLAHSVMRHPGRYLLVSAVILGFLAVPFLHVRFGGIDERVLPDNAEARQVSAVLTADFGADPSSPVIVAVSLADPLDSAAGKAALAGYVSDVAKLPDATGAEVVGARGSTARVDVSYRGQSLDGPARSLVTDVRALPAPPGVSSVLVGGATAALIDRLDSIGSTLPWMALLVGLSTFILLFLAFGSVVLPIKAILLNMLSLGASLGVVTWIFQEGHLSGLLGFTPTGFVEATQPILVVAIVFGLSMDYEVFLLSRIREQYDLTGDNRQAVAVGLQRTGRIITSAALLIVVVIAAFSTSSISFIKLIGVAMLVAIVIDALLIRMLVVPAVMRLMGNVNWWAPRPLRGLYARYGIKEAEPDPDPAPEPTEPTSVLGR